MDNEIAKSVARNTMVQMAQQLITWASSFVLMLFLPRYLGSADYGKLYLATSLVGIFSILVNYDGRLNVAKRIARSQEATAEIIVNSIGFRIVFWSIALIAIMLFSYIANYQLGVKILILIFGIEMLWSGARNVLHGVFQGYEVLQYSSISSIVEKIFVSIIGVAALLLGAKSLVIAIIMVLGSLLSFFISIYYTKNIVFKFPKIRFDASIKLIKEGFPFFLWTIFGVIYFRVDAVMLSLMTNETVVGWYGASYKFFDMLAFLPSIYSITVLPILSKLWAKEENKMAWTTQKSLEFIILAGIPMSIGVFGFSHDIIKLFFGLEEYAPSVLNLKIFSVGLLLIYIDMILGTAIIASDRQKQWTLVAFFGIIVNILLNYFMIPYTQTVYDNGGVGSAIATIITEYFVMCCAVFILPRMMIGRSLNMVIFKSILSGMIMGLSLWIMNNISVFWVFQLFVSAAVYIVCIIMLRVYAKEEIAVIKNSLSLKNLKRGFTIKKRNGSINNQKDE